MVRKNFSSFSLGRKQRRGMFCFSHGSMGFTLVEIMVVVGVITVILAIGLPKILRARVNANEVAAIASCRLISNVCQTFYLTAATRAYPTGLSDLRPPTSNPPYIDAVLASGAKQGYAFIYVSTSSDYFTLNVNPRAQGRTGERYFFVDETGIIRWKTGGAASASDPAL